MPAGPRRDTQRGRLAPAPQQEITVMKVVTLVRRGMLAALFLVLSAAAFAGTSNTWLCQSCGREQDPGTLASSLVYVDTGRSLAGNPAPGACDINHQQSLSCPSPLMLGSSMTEQAVGMCNS